MLMPELSHERITTGLPLEINDVPNGLVDALAQGVIKESDLVPNIAAMICSKYRPDIEPPLTIYEQVERTRHINRIATNCVEQFLTR